MVGHPLRIGSLLPPICPVCRELRSATELREGGPCRECRSSLATALPGTGPPPEGVDWAVSAFRHDGIARRALNAFKFERRTSLAGPLAAMLAARLSAFPVRGWLLPVPQASFGGRFRGFDPACSIASELGARFPGAPLLTGCLIRSRAGRQRGRDRRTRLEAADRFEVRGRVAGPVVLVDDVLTTGATLSACARVVRLAGGGPVGAVTVTRRP